MNLQNNMNKKFRDFDCKIVVRNDTICWFHEIFVEGTTCVCGKEHTKSMFGFLVLDRPFDTELCG